MAFPERYLFIPNFLIIDNDIVSSQVSSEKIHFYLPVFSIFSPTSSTRRYFWKTALRLHEPTLPTWIESWKYLGIYVLLFLVLNQRILSKGALTRDSIHLPPPHTQTESSLQDQPEFCSVGLSKITQWHVLLSSLILLPHPLVGFSLEHFLNITRHPDPQLRICFWKI